MHLDCRRGGFCTQNLPQLRSQIFVLFVYDKGVAVANGSWTSWHAVAADHRSRLFNFNSFRKVGSGNLSNALCVSLSCAALRSTHRRTFSVAWEWDRERLRTRSRDQLGGCPSSRSSTWSYNELNSGLSSSWHSVEAICPLWLGLLQPQKAWARPSFPLSTSCKISSTR